MRGNRARCPRSTHRHRPRPRSPAGSPEPPAEHRYARRSRSAPPSWRARVHLPIWKRVPVSNTWCCWFKFFIFSELVALKFATPPFRVCKSIKKIEITSQNHSYAVDEKTLKGTGLEVTHKNILDNTIEGVQSRKDKIFSVQYHPESAPGPQDSSYLFDKFIEIMKGEK